MNAPVITSTAPVDNPIRTTTPRPWPRVGGRGSLMSICAARRGARNVASHSSASTRAKQAVTPKARRRAARRALTRVRSRPASMDIGQQAQKPHPEPPDGVHDSAVARIDHDVRLRADAQGTYLLVERDPYRHRLGWTDPPALAARARQAGPRIDAAVRDAIAS